MNGAVHNSKSWIRYCLLLIFGSLLTGPVPSLSVCTGSAPLTPGPEIHFRPSRNQEHHLWLMGSTKTLLRPGSSSKRWVFHCHEKWSSYVPVVFVSHNISAKNQKLMIYPVRPKDLKYRGQEKRGLSRSRRVFVFSFILFVFKV